MFVQSRPPAAVFWYSFLRHRGDYVKRYNNDWTVINYDGQEAYVSSQYIEKKASESEPSSEEDAESASGTDAAEVQAQ